MDFSRATNLAEPLDELIGQLMRAGGHDSPEDALRAALARLQAPTSTPSVAPPSEPASRLTAILDGIAEAFYILDRNWRMTFINRAAELYFGRPRDTMLGRVVWDIFPWSYGSALKARYEDALASGRPTSFEEASVGVPGRRVEITLFPLDGGLGVSFRDWTQRYEAERALRESENRLRLAMDAGRIAIWEYDVPSGRLQTSPELNEFLGYPRDHVLDLEEVYPRYFPGDRERVQQAGQAAVKAGDRFFQVEFRFSRDPGRYRWFLLRADIIKDGAGAPVSVIGVLLDIDERKRTSENLEESEARLTALADNLPLGMVYQIAASPDGSDRRFVYLSGTCERVNGIPAEEALADPGRLYALIRPEHVPRMMEAEAEALRLEKPFDIEIEFRHARTGEHRWYRMISAPRHLPDGTLVFDGIQIDVTDQKRAEEAVRRSEEGLRTILNEMPLGVLLARMPGGELVFHNAKAAELVGHPIGPTASIGALGAFGSLHPDGTPYRTDEYPVARTILRGEDIDQEEMLYRRGDGRIVNLAVSSTPVYSSADGEGFAVCAFYDVTERKQAEEHQALLIHELNHRVKNTLATVQSIAAQSFREAEASGEASRIPLTRAAFEQRLFALARAHDVLTQENWESAGLKDIVDEAVAPYRGGIDYHVFLTEGPNLRVSPQMALSLSMGLHELCTNAVKYGALSRPSGHVRIAWSEVEKDGSDGKESGPWLHLRWQERGGPPVSAPTRRGFGTRLIERGVARELSGDVFLDYEPEGLTCTIDVPLKHWGM